MQSWWNWFGFFAVIDLIMMLVVSGTFCWSMWFVSIPTVFAVGLVFRVGCPEQCCCTLCPDAGDDIIDATKWMNKALRGFGGFFIVAGIVTVVSGWLAKLNRDTCASNECISPDVSQPMTEAECNQKCGCAAAAVVVVCVITLVFNLITAGIAFKLARLGEELGGVRRRTAVDTIPESDTEDEEDGDGNDDDPYSGNTLHANLIPAANDRVQPKKPALFSRLADALAAPAGQSAPAPVQMKEYKIDLGSGSSSSGRSSNGGGGVGGGGGSSSSGGDGEDPFGEFAGANTNSNFNPAFGIEGDADVQSFMAEVDTTSDV